MTYYILGSVQVRWRKRNDRIPYFFDNVNQLMNTFLSLGQTIKNQAPSVITKTTLADRTSGTETLEQVAR